MLITRRTRKGKKVLLPRTPDKDRAPNGVTLTSEIRKMQDQGWTGHTWWNSTGESFTFQLGGKGPKYKIVNCSILDTF
jgi:hypothetical protein